MSNRQIELIRNPDGTLRTGSNLERDWDTEIEEVTVGARIMLDGVRYSVYLYVNPSLLELDPAAVENMLIRAAEKFDPAVDYVGEIVAS